MNFEYIAASVGVERTFSKGRLVLSHLRNRLESESTRALMCLSEWSMLDMVDTKDFSSTARLPEVQKDEVVELPKEWDAIKL